MEQENIEDIRFKNYPPEKMISVYYADVFSLLNKLEHLYKDYYIECEELTKLHDFMREFMKNETFDTRFDTEISIYLKAIHADIESNADVYGKDLWTARMLYSRINNMLKPQARLRALNAKSLAEYSMLMDSIYNGNQKI